MLDANYVVASTHPRPWKKQLNIMAVYLYFYNPVRFLKALVRPRSKLYLADAGMQLIGMWGPLPDHPPNDRLGGQPHARPDPPLQPGPRQPDPHAQRRGGKGLPRPAAGHGAADTFGADGI
jgi:hypothetical protein